MRRHRDSPGERKRKLKQIGGGYKADISYCNANEFGAPKVIYDKKGATSAANRRFKEDHQKLAIYPCSGHWHVTKQTRGDWHRNR